VEVKGSSGEADTVELTANEVRHAHETEACDLVVVDRIHWVVASNGDIETSGGRARIWKDWRPKAAHLTPTRYRYSLPKKATEHSAARHRWRERSAP
jgi:hypothetical protein